MEPSARLSVAGCGATRTEQHTTHSMNTPQPPHDKSRPKIQPGRYRHYKGKEYQVIGVAKHSETEEDLVVYRALYGACGLWVRPAKMFSEKIEMEGKLISRFEWIDDTTAAPDTTLRKPSED
jgi:cyclomaltodextrinase